MLESKDHVRDHYEAGISDVDELLRRLSGLIPECARAEDLARLDQFHAGGLDATLRLAEKVGVQPNMDILDAGSGLGGPARALAQHYNCRVIGVDLSPHFVALARALNGHADLEGRVAFQVGDLMDLAFESDLFDLVWTQHVVMNVPDRAKAYREFRRVLKPDGRLAFFDPILADAGLEVLYPTPWARDADASTLLTEAQTRAELNDAGFEPVWIEDVTQPIMATLMAQQTRPSASSPRQAQLGMVMGDRFGPAVMNFARNLQEGRLRLVMGCCKRRD